MYKRSVEARVREALTDTPVVLVVGPRRVGKTTLVRGLAEDDRSYFTLDDPTTLNVARTDPSNFIRGLDRAIIDEVQRLPELMLAIKRSVDDDYRPGRFLLTGSANVLALPRLADSLAGRMEIVTMLPLAQTELLGQRSTFLERLFDGNLKKAARIVVGDDLIRVALTGGFPEALTRTNDRRRQAWVRAYLRSVLTRDLRDIAEIDRLAELPRFVQLLSEHSGKLINYSEIGSAINISHKTSQRYVALLEHVYLIHTLRPWHTNAIKRVIKTPKIHFLDPAILSASRGLTTARLRNDRQDFGALLESFVFGEIMRLLTWSEEHFTPYHFRDQQRHEVDVVLERDDGRIAGIEVKAAASVGVRDFAGLRLLSQAAKNRFASGAVLYDGDTVVPFGERLAAVPISCLWD